MSYNITRWKTKELTDLTVPLTAFYTHPRTDWHPRTVVNPTSGMVTLHCGGEQDITGVVKDELLVISDLHMTGEGSGTFYRWIFEPALKASTGTLVAVLVWEGGDSITRLTVKDGVVTEEEVEL